MPPEFEIQVAPIAGASFVGGVMPPEFEIQIAPITGAPFVDGGYAA
ncbi:MAG TPA: hypothetical protein VH299_13790 [Solirubrobacterales bacterium]|jgi:hypothetical protein|nr:hypothetical protein [Solirubrobacterales bacterium]